MKPVSRKYILVFLLMMGSLLTIAQTDSILQEIIFIGDAGELTRGKHPVLHQLQQSQLATNRKSLALFFLGDNIYPAGLPNEASRDYSTYKAILDTQWITGRELAEQVFFIPGNHDWAKGTNNGWQQVKNQDKYMQDLNLPNLFFLPGDGCPGPEERNLNDQLTVVVMDSQWWLQQAAKPGVSSDCDCKTEDEILFRLQEILYRNRQKIILFLSHHPFVSSGIHGGYYKFRQHLFPLTEINPKLYIPLPLIGSLYPLIRGGFGNIQDNKHPAYKNMSSRVDSLLKKHGRVLRFAGHEHGLQHFHSNHQHYIVSGAGSKATRHRKNTTNRISFSTTGYAKLQWLTNGTLQLVFMEAKEKIHQELYRQQLTLPATNEFTLSDSTGIRRQDSISLAAAPYFKANKLKQRIFGSNYRQEWITPVKVPVFFISTYKGGLHPTKRGGGMQSRSLRLEDSSGREYVLRSIEKYPDKTLPEELRQTFVKDAIVDGISASYPFAALSVPVLVSAAGIPHTEPSLVFLPNDPALGQYRSDFGNKLYLFEPREPAGLTKTYSTEKVLDALSKDNDNRVDQQAVLKARLLDMYIMDFDRHDDQWRWGSIEKNEGRLYFPIPRDRDQAFFTNRGLLPWLVSRSWLLPKFQGFREKAENINRFNYNARYFDRSFLNRTSRSDWEKLANQLIQQMTDAVIDSAMKMQPASIQSMQAGAIAATLKKRKHFFVSEVLKYQQFLHKTIELTGSNKKDWFELNWKKEGLLKLTIFDINKEGKPSDKLSEQQIDPGVTKEIRLFGLKGGDVFRIRGEMPKGLIIRIISGEGKDSLALEQSGNRPSAVKWYDSYQEANQLSGTGKFNRKFSNLAAVHSYDRKSFRYNITTPLLLASYNRDDGVFLGAGVRSTHHSFRKEPFAYQHQFNAFYAVATGAYQFRYLFDAPSFRFFANLKAPNNTRNFFGFGNQTNFAKNDQINITYYRSRFNLFELATLAKYHPVPSLQMNAGPVFQHYWIDYDDNKDRFITKPESGLDQERLKQKKTYLGLQAQAVIDTRNNSAVPTRGVHWTNTMRWVNGISRVSNSFTQWESTFSYFISLIAPNQVVLAGRMGGGGNYGNYEFFQAQYLGGNESLRGYRNFRFAGDKRFFNNFDIRIKLTELRGYVLPGTLGLLFFQDIGRVWLKDEVSRRWHLGYGGGIWLAPANRFVVAVCYGQSEEGGLPFVSLGFQF